MVKGKLGPIHGSKHGALRSSLGMAYTQHPRFISKVKTGRIGLVSGLGCPRVVSVNSGLIQLTSRPFPKFAAGPVRAPTANPDGRSGPEVSLYGQARCYETGTSGNRGRAQAECRAPGAVRSWSQGLFYRRN